MVISLKEYLTRYLLPGYLSVFFLLIVYFLFLSLNVLPEQFYRVSLPNGKIIKAELAVDKAKGLQGRKQLCPQCGMIFVFDKEDTHSFWMKDTIINLAIVWTDEKGRILHIVKNAEPCNYKYSPEKECKVYTTPKPSKYVLEINPSDAEGLNTDMFIRLSFTGNSTQYNNNAFIYNYYNNHVNVIELS